MYKTLPSFPVATDKFAEHVERVDEMVLTPHYDECKTVSHYTQIKLPLFRRSEF